MIIPFKRSRRKPIGNVLDANVGSNFFLEKKGEPTFSHELASPSLHFLQPKNLQKTAATSPQGSVVSSWYVRTLHLGAAILNTKETTRKDTLKTCFSRALKSP